MTNACSQEPKMGVSKKIAAIRYYNSVLKSCHSVGIAQIIERRSGHGLLPYGKHHDQEPCDGATRTLASVAEQDFWKKMWCPTSITFLQMKYLNTEWYR